MKKILAALLFLSVSAQAQIVEKARTFADLTSSHPCSSGLAGRHAIVTDCDAADDIGDGGGSFSCFARCDGTAPWETVAIGAGASGGVSGLDTADGGTALSDNAIVRGDGATGIQGSTVTLADSTGNLQWEGPTADTFEGTFTFADPTADWTWAWGADGALTGVGGFSVNANGRVETGDGTNGGVNLGNDGARLSDCNADGRLCLYAGGSQQADIVDVGGGFYRFRFTGGSGISGGNVLLNGNVTLNADTTFGRVAAGHTSLDAATHLTPTAAPPRTCDATAEGDIYSDTSHALCWCSGSAWTVVIGAGSCA